MKRIVVKTKTNNKKNNKVVQYENAYRLCYIRGAVWILIGLVEQLGNK